MDEAFVIHTDGGSRGNPGPAACAFVVEKEGETSYESSKYLGIATNNFAEYQGVLLAIDWLSENSSAIFYLDSELVVKQLNGMYKVKNENIKENFQKIVLRIKSKKLKVVFKNVPREKNKEADLLVNTELDKKH